MAKFSKIQVIDMMNTTCVVPVFYHKNVEVVKNVLQACYEGGIKVFEFTNRGEFAHELFGLLNKFVIENCPELILGAGSIVDAPTASMYIQLGANFIVGPLFKKDVSRIANRRLILYIPGCGSVSEVGAAQEAGCDLCKIFPGDVLGYNFIKNVKAPMPWSQFMVTGGVKPEENNLKLWFDAGVTCVGMGSSLFLKREIDEEDWDKIRERCHQILSLIKRVKNK